MVEGLEWSQRAVYSENGVHQFVPSTCRGHPVWALSSQGPDEVHELRALFWCFLQIPLTTCSCALRVTIWMRLQNAFRDAHCTDTHESYFQYFHAGRRRCSPGGLVATMETLDARGCGPAAARFCWVSCSSWYTRPLNIWPSA